MAEQPHAGTGGTVVVVVAGGQRLDRSVASRVPPDAHVIAADSGVDHALAIGLAVHEAIGDFDSVTPHGLACVEATGGRLERHPADKDATDLELALDRAVERRPDALLLLDGGGGRLDHLLANVFAMARADLATFAPRALVGDAELVVVHGGRSVVLGGSPGQLVSLLPVHGAADGVTTTGLRWPLSGARLEGGTSWGVSNLMVDVPATVTVERGVLVTVQPATWAAASEPGSVGEPGEACDPAAAAAGRAASGERR